MIKIFFFITTILFFTGCSEMKISDFKDTQPEFIPSEYFNGKLKAYGMVKDRSGKITRRFTGDLVGSWDKDGVGTLDEFFVYDDGETQKRVWKLVPVKGKKSYIGTAGDIIGEAPMVYEGNSVMIDYIMRIPYSDSTIDISVKDWLHLQEDGVILNHSKMKKFGFTVGELIITIIKVK